MSGAVSLRLPDAEAVAERLGMSARRALAEDRAGRLPHYRLGRRFEAAEVEQYVAGHHRPATVGLRIGYPSAVQKGSRHAGSGSRVPEIAENECRNFPPAS
jgi:hypothetical protein